MKSDDCPLCEKPKEAGHACKEADARAAVAARRLSKDYEPHCPHDVPGKPIGHPTFTFTEAEKASGEVKRWSDQGCSVAEFYAEDPHQPRGNRRLVKHSVVSMTEIDEDGNEVESSYIYP